MYDEKLLQEVTAKAQTWLSDSYDEKTRAEVQAMLDNEDKTDLVESFYKTLEERESSAFAGSLDVLDIQTEPCFPDCVLRNPGPQEGKAVDRMLSQNVPCSAKSEKYFFN